ncbi:hypothetical protein [Nucisporomicrobium flavum]|uniref:hypothetical protein n=1 Tax=Nucisporomicrobium flavum TaxID=2785915 RepID=UPI0018F3BF7C|nr:hypothetical protein [Nucisporomicrobium flavum]
MTESRSPAASAFFTALAELREATRDISYATLVREAGKQQPPVKITAQRLSDWFGGKGYPVTVPSCASWSHTYRPAPPARAATKNVRCRGGSIFTGTLCRNDRPIAMTPGAVPGIRRRGVG